MIRQDEIALVIDSGKKNFLNRNPGFTRDSLTDIPIVDTFATIITGIRRAGKSTLLLQLFIRDYTDAIYLSFDDLHLSGFEVKDFIRLHKEIEERGVKVLFLDKIQIVEGWEKYITQLLHEGYKVFITSSNASLLSGELGAHLTGSHLPMEVFPFSYSEFIRFRNLESGEEAVMDYLKTGGIPEYVKATIPVILTTLVDDILMKDIVVRRSIRDIASLRLLTSYLIANIGNLVSANQLVGMFRIKSPASISEYFSYLKDAYLFDFVPIFNYSLKVQARNPKKVYLMDTGIYTETSISTSDNLENRFENLIFLHLRRKYRYIFYYKEERSDCDFITIEKNSVKDAIQTCLTIDDENFEKKYDDLLSAMRNLHLKEGTIVTLNQSDTFQEDDMIIKIIPAHEFLTL